MIICFLCDEAARYKMEWYAETGEGDNELMQQWACKDHARQLEETEAAMIIDELLGDDGT